MLHFKFRCVDIVEVSSRKGLKADGPRFKGSVVPPDSRGYCRRGCGHSEAFCFPAAVKAVEAIFQFTRTRSRTGRTERQSKEQSSRRTECQHAAGACVLTYMHKSNETSCRTISEQVPQIRNYIRIRLSEQVLLLLSRV